MREVEGYKAVVTGGFLGSRAVSCTCRCGQTCEHGGQSGFSVRKSKVVIEVESPDRTGESVSDNEPGLRSRGKTGRRRGFGFSRRSRSGPNPLLVRPLSRPSLYTASMAQYFSLICFIPSRCGHIPARTLTIIRDGGIQRQRQGYSAGARQQWSARGPRR